ncbi:MAG TPA: holo-ACP synthase [Anaerolineales bacterium]|nr:holo-ACP synthase [Anaerolineales bacterium]
MRSVLSTGVDIIEIKRFEDTIERQGDKFLKRIFTDLELLDCGGKTESLAARFAAKEAVSKALGTGIGIVSWHDLEITKNSDDQPVINLHGEASVLAESLNLVTWSVSLSHTKELAIALVVAIG